jgi:hypothetical protein
MLSGRRSAGAQLMLEIGEVEGGGAGVGQLRDLRREIAEHPLVPGVGDRAEEAYERLGTVERERPIALSFGAVLDGEQERNDVYRVIWLEVGEKDAIHGGGVVACAEQATHGTAT